MFGTVTPIIGNIAELLPFRLVLVEFDARETTVAATFERYLERRARAMSRQPDVVVSNSPEEVSPVDDVPFTHWKDPRGYNGVLGRCQPCHAKGKAVALQNKAKALNHWAGDGSGQRDVTARIKPDREIPHRKKFMSFCRS